LQVSTLPLPIDTPISPIVAYFSYQHYYYNPKKKKNQLFTIAPFAPMLQTNNSIDKKISTLYWFGSTQNQVF
jgi:hypothetical protein